MTEDEHVLARGAEEQASSGLSAYRSLWKSLTGVLLRGPQPFWRFWMV